MPSPSTELTPSHHGDGHQTRRRPARLVNPPHFLITEWYRRDMDDQPTRRLHPTTSHRARQPTRHTRLLDRQGHDLVGELVGTQPITTAQSRFVSRKTSCTKPAGQSQHVDELLPHLDPAELRTFSSACRSRALPIHDAAGVRCATSQAATYACGMVRTEWSLGITDQVPPFIDADGALPSSDVLATCFLMPPLGATRGWPATARPHRGLWLLPRVACGSCRPQLDAPRDPCWTFRLTTRDR